MKKRPDTIDTQPFVPDKVVEPGERSIRKSDYPQLQKQLEEMEAMRRELAESQERYRSLVENIDDVIFSLDVAGVVTYVSPVIESLSGFGAEEMIGKSLGEFIHPEDSSAVEANFHQVLMTGEPNPIEYRLRCKDDAFRYVRSSSRPLLKNEEVVGLTGVMSDTTGFKQAERERQQYAEFLANMDRVSRAMQQKTDLDEMMSAVLDEVLDILACDRAALVYPCDPGSAAWMVCMERTRAEYPGILSPDVEIPTEAEAAAVFRAVLDSGSPVKFGPGASHPLPAHAAEQFDIRSQVAMSIHPKRGKPWMFVLHQCSYPRVWTDEEIWLLQEIGRRMADGLTSLLVMRELRESERKYRRFVETSNEGVCALDSNGTITFANDRTFEMFGYPPDEMVGKPLTDFIFDSNIVDQKQHMAVRRRGTAEHYEQRFRRKDGSELWLLISASAIQDEEGNFRGSFAMFSDITERKQAEEKVLQSEQRLRLHTELSPLGFLEWDENFCATEWNAACERIFGYTRKEALGRHVKDLIVPATAQGAVDEVFQNLMHQAGGQHSINENLTKDGRIVIVEWFNTTLISKDGKAIGVASICRDITERKRSERELLASEQLFRALVENSPDYIARYDRDYRRTYVNPSIQELFAAEPDNVLGQTPADRSPMKTPQVYIEHLKKVFETGKECTLESPFRTARGEMHWGHIRFTPEFDADGNVASVLSIGRDVHEIKDSEQRLRRFIATLPAFFFTFRRTGDGRYCFPYASPGIKTIYGLDPEDVKDDMTPLHMLAHPDDRPHIEAAIAQALEKLEPFNVEFRVCRPDMPERWIEARSIAHEETDGSMLWYGIMLDITNRKQAEQELTRSEEKFSRAFYASPNLMAITNPEDGRIIEINEAFCRLFGYEREECIGRNTVELQMWVDPEQRAAAARQLDKKGAALYMPVDLRTKSGEIRSVIDSMVFINLDNQKRLLSVATDVTERKQAEERLQESLVETIRAIALMVEKRDPYTAGHQIRVARLCTAIGGELGLDAARMEGLRLGSMIHDIGKIYVPAEILNRPGTLQAPELGMIRGHPQVGYEILKGIAFPWPVAEMILQHHERLDGSGYPQGLKGADILLESRIIAVADVVEAMSSHRPYRPALGIDAALLEIKSHRGTQYDPAVVDACLHLFGDGHFTFEE
ncbi:MAG: PAS domain S-box protein [Gammaproteobacteria bacterium]